MTDPIHATGIEAGPIPGDPLLSARHPGPCALVLFGATGDLAHRKIVPSLYNLARDGGLPEAFAVLGVGRRDLGTDAFREGLRAAAAVHSRRLPLVPEAWRRFADAVGYVRGSFEDDGTYRDLKAALEESDRTRGTAGNRLFYLATPSEVFPTVLDGLHRSGLLGPAGPKGPWTRVVVEKPFGHDLASARDLNALLARYLDERQVLRIDHYLGKETVQNILVFRFANAIFEPLWNRKYIDSVEITASEEIGVEGRGKFYESAGVLRDIIQNHLLQVLCLCAMEPPVSFGADDVRDEKAQVLRSLRPITGADALRDVALGQYRGYREEEGVAPDSRVPTCAALRVMIDNWRWQGVPFYLRAGKRLATRRTEAVVRLQPVPLCLFPRGEACQSLEPNRLRLRIQPEEGISLRFVAKVPGEHLSVGNVAMHMDYAGAFGTPLSDAYERLLVDAMRGDATLFARRDWVELAWGFVTPILDAWAADARLPTPYEPGSAGPPDIEDLPARDGRSWEPLHP